MVLIVYVLLITRALLYVLQGTIWNLLEVSFSIWIWFDGIYHYYEMTAFINSFSLHVPESLRYLSMYDNRCLRYFKGHKQRFEPTFSWIKFSLAEGKLSAFFQLRCAVGKEHCLLSQERFLLLYHFLFVLGNI